VSGGRPTGGDVAVVGPGRLGTLLAIACSRAGYRPTAVAGSDEAARRRLAARVAGARPVATAAEAASRADLVLLTVPDAAIAGVVAELVRADAVGPGQLVVHVAGPLGSGELALAGGAGAGVAACHPALAVPAGADDPGTLVGVPWGVTAPPAHRGAATTFVTDLGGDPYPVAEDRRALYHAGVTVALDAAGGVLATARQLLLAAGVSDPTPLLGEVAGGAVATVVAQGAAGLAGPLARGGDSVPAHLGAIDTDVPVLGTAYRRALLAALAPLRHELPASTLAELETLLSSDGSGVPGPHR
jgi:predicted short-subunit dehydrogenase-like oxidoreductase (DUF2520 family)